MQLGIMVIAGFVQFGFAKRRIVEEIFVGGFIADWMGVGIHSVFVGSLLIFKIKILRSCVDGES